MATVELIQHQGALDPTGVLHIVNMCYSLRVCVCVSSGPDAVLVGAFSTWTQKLNLRTQQLRFDGEAPPPRHHMICEMSAWTGGLSWVLQVQDQPGTGPWF